MNLKGLVLAAERAWDSRGGDSTPEHFRIEPYIGHGGPAGTVVRGRVLDNPVASEAMPEEGVRAATRRTLRHFVTDELPGVPLRVTVAGVSVDAESDAEGYFLVRVPPPAGSLTAPWTTGTVELRGDYRGVSDAEPALVEVRVPATDARFGVLSDVDDTILEPVEPPCLPARVPAAP